jgi:hypothetical protein
MSGLKFPMIIKSIQESHIFANNLSGRLNNRPTHVNQSGADSDSLGVLGNASYVRKLDVTRQAETVMCRSAYWQSIVMLN